MSMAGALAGTRVIDASSYLTGPFAAMLLADLGADVLKVEPPRGDPFRRVGRRHNGAAISFTSVNRNKRGVTLDLRQSEDFDEFQRLLADADVLVTNWRPETTRQIGLDEALVDAHPRLIWIRISGFGPDGPHANDLAFDAVIQARSGLAWAQGDGVAPTMVHGWVCDKITAMFAAQAAMAGLVRRNQTGKGGVTDLPMVDAVAYFNFPDVMVQRTLVDDDGPALNRHLTVHRPVETSDGWIFVSPVAGRHISAALTALGLEDRKPELLAITDPTELADAFCVLTESRTRTKPSAHWLSVLTAHGVPVSPVLDLDQHLADPQVVHNEVYRVVEHPELGSVRAPHHPAAPDGAIGPSPALGDRAERIT